MNNKKVNTSPWSDKPADALDPLGKDAAHKTIAILATGGTFLCSTKVTPRTPIYHKTLADFIEASNLRSPLKT